MQIQNDSVTGLFPSYKPTATAAGTTILTAASDPIQHFTGTTTQTVTMPVTSTLQVGFPYTIINSSTRAVTVNSSGGNEIVKLAPGTQAELTCILTSGTDAASWTYKYSWLGGYGASNVTFLTAAQGAPLFYPDGIWRYEHTLSSSDITSMYATPVAVLAAPAAGKAYNLLGTFSQSFITHGGTTYTGGGTHFLQYSNTINGAGTQWSLSWAASTNGLLATTTIIRQGWGAGSPIVNPNLVNGIGIWASNATAAYATGNGTLTYRLAYLLQDVP